MYCIYTEGSQPGTGRIRLRGESKARAILIAQRETRFGRLRHCDYVAVMPTDRACALIRTGGRA